MLQTLNTIINNKLIKLKNKTSAMKTEWMGYFIAIQ